MEGSQLKVFNILILTVLAAFLTDIQSVQGQPVYTRNVTVLEGERDDILCRLDKPLRYCGIEIPGEKFVPLKPPGFTCYGEGLFKGHCGVTIQSVQNIHNDIVNCYLQADGDELEGQVGLTVALAPLRLELKINTKSQSGFYEIGEEFRVTCISHDGRPPSNISFYLDDEPIAEGLGINEVIKSIDSKNTTLYTSRKTITQLIRASHHRRTLICRADHIANRGQPQEVRMQFQVRYRPQPLPPIKVSGLVLGSDAIINVTINSNPRPRTKWTVGDLSIPQGKKIGSYESHEPIDLGGGDMFNTSLTILSLKLEDLNKTYYLSASNEFGSRNYTVHITSWEAAPTNGSDTGALVGIIVGVAVLIILVAAAITFYKILYIVYRFNV